VTGSGWVNTLLRATWQTALEPALAAQAAENLQEALDKARPQSARSGPTRGAAPAPRGASPHASADAALRVARGSW